MNAVEPRLLLGDMELLAARDVTIIKALKHEMSSNKIQINVFSFLLAVHMKFPKFCRLNWELYP